MPDKRLKILIVEDEAIVAMMVEDFVAELGHEAVATASRLAHALDAARTLEIDFALIDVNLDGEHSYEVAELLARRGIAFAFVTGYGVAGLKEEWRDAIVLQKPFQAADINQAIRSAVYSRSNTSL